MCKLINWLNSTVKIQLLNLFYSGFNFATAGASTTGFSFGSGAAAPATGANPAAPNGSGFGKTRILNG